VARAGYFAFQEERYGGEIYGPVARGVQELYEASGGKDIALQAWKTLVGGTPFLATYEVEANEGAG